MAKPTGALGPFIVTVNPDGTAMGSFVQIAMPETKVEVERCIVDRFIASMNQYLEQEGQRFLLSDPVSNEEDDFDFAVQSPEGEAFLELMEIAPLKGPYKEAPHRHKIYDFAQVIYQGILQKSQRYPMQMTRPLFLLVYVTHWAFTLPDEVIACVRYWCDKTPLAFRAVFSFQAIDEQEGSPHWIFPVPPDMLGDFDPEKFREATFINFDPGKWQVT